MSQPGVSPVVSYLQALRREIKPKCENGHYYLLNNYNPGYFGDGSNAYTDTNASNYVYTIPPSSVRNIGDALTKKNVSWAYYGDQWNAYLNDKYQLQFNSGQDEYCNICNWAQYSTSIMTDAAVRTAHLKDTTDLYAAISAGTLPAVSYVKPSGWSDGHPASSKLNLFEDFVEKIVESVKAKMTFGRKRQSSSPSMRAADTTTRATFNRLTTSVTAPVSHCSSCRRTAKAATSLIPIRIMSRP